VGLWPGTSTPQKKGRHRYHHAIVWSSEVPIIFVLPYDTISYDTPSTINKQNIKEHKTDPKPPGHGGVKLVATRLCNERPLQSMKTMAPAVTWILTIELISTIAASFSFDAVSIFRRAIPPAATLKTTRTICNAKLQKIASSYDLDAIFSIEKELTAEEAETSFENLGRKRSSNYDQKKKMMKQKMKQQKQAMQQIKQKQRTQNSSAPNDDSHIIDGYDDGSIDADPGIDYVSLMQEINFSAYEVPLDLVGKRIDAVLVELLNKENDNSNNQASNPLSISRSQCGTLLSSGFVFVVPPEDANEFKNTWRTDEETTPMPPETIEKFCAPIQRKSHILEPSSILIYPSRDSLLSTSSSSTLLSNFISPTEIIAQKISLDILFEDEHMIVINKQAGIVV
jgi:23S rRNA-/tRNA-specific pseudouridylate synthase